MSETTDIGGTRSTAKVPSRVSLVQDCFVTRLGSSNVLYSCMRSAVTTKDCMYIAL
jgi:hypothetical protein